MKHGNMKHGMCGTKIYDIFGGMVQRCYNSKNKEYHNYGGRGIIISDIWRHDFKKFYNWSKDNGYTENSGLYIERIDNNGIYSPENCKWATSKEQSLNRRTNVKIEFDNEIKTLKEWSQDVRCIISYSALCTRIRKGWSAEKALTYREKL